MMLSIWARYNLYIIRWSENGNAVLIHLQRELINIQELLWTT